MAFSRRTSSSGGKPRGFARNEGSVAGSVGMAEESNAKLRFGDEISLFDFSQRGFVGSFVTSSAHSTLTVKPGGSPANPGVGNFKNCVFSVLAKTKYAMAKNLRQLTATYRKKNEQSLTVEDALARTDEKGKAQLLLAQSLAELEAEDNRLEQKRRRGDVVVYGQTVLLEQTTTRDFVRMSSAATSRHEPSNMKVDMTSSPTRHSWFRIMPRYKVRAEGDPVRMSDQIVFESVKTLGQFLHTSNEALPEWSPNFGQMEVNLSVAPTAYKIIEHRQVDDTEENALYGMDLLQLHHKEVGGYVAAEGIYCDTKPRTDVHLRIRPADPQRPRRLSPPSSSVSYFQIEFAEAPTYGGPVRWDNTVRLKHVGTQMYLSLDSHGFEGTAKLVREPDESGTVFSFHAVIMDSSHVDLGSYARIQHRQTGSWLHAAMDQPVRRAFQGARHEGADPGLTDRMSSIVWDKAPLTQLSSTPEQLFDDAFIVTPVPESRQRNTVFAIGMVDILLYYLRIRGQREVTLAEAAGVKMALDQLYDFCFDRGVCVKEAVAQPQYCGPAD
eukprot:m.350051 g.350051  ORF g.350051 m.350051 type:complete len:553 (+) comp19886_c0_seq3:209-1867(+)